MIFKSRHIRIAMSGILLGYAQTSLALTIPFQKTLIALGLSGGLIAGGVQAPALINAFSYEKVEIEESQNALDDLPNHMYMDEKPYLFSGRAVLRLADANSPKSIFGYISSPITALRRTTIEKDVEGGKRKESQWALANWWGKRKNFFVPNENTGRLQPVGYANEQVWQTIFGGGIRSEYKIFKQNEQGQNEHVATYVQVEAGQKTFEFFTPDRTKLLGRAELGVARNWVPGLNDRWKVFISDEAKEMDLGAYFLQVIAQETRSDWVDHWTLAQFVITIFTESDSREDQTFGMIEPPADVAADVAASENSVSE